MVASTGNNTLSLLDVSKRTDPTGAVAVIAELLSQKNEIMSDIPWQEGNLQTGTRNTLRTGLPQINWKIPNTGTNGSKSTTAQIDEACGILEGWSIIDYDVAMLNGNVNKYRLTEADAFIESMMQQLCGTLWYGNQGVNTERFTGFGPRYGAITNAVNQQNIINSGGSGATTTSVWLIGWGPNTIYGVYPRGTVGGLQHQDFGRRPIQTSTTLGQGFLDAYVDKWQWKCGLAVKDWRYACRVANVMVPDLTGGSGTQNAQQLIKQMVRATARMPSYAGITPRFYMNRTVFSMLMVQALDKSQNILAIQAGASQFGTPQNILTFLNIPIRISDQLLLTESAIS